MKKSWLIPVLVLMLAGCRSAEKKEKLFTLRAPEQTGVAFENRLTENESFNIIEYLYFNNGAGVAAGDINNDGLIDLYFTANQGPNHLYLNQGSLQFKDITETAGVAGTGDWKTGVTMADVNGDGWLDIYVCQLGDYKIMHGRNQLFINKGDNTFKDEAAAYGLDFCGFSTQAAFFDYDADDDLDMYLLNHSVHSSRNYGMRSDLLPLEDSLAGDILYRNDEKDGKRVFHDVSREAGISGSPIGYGLGVSVSDVNNDGWPDLYISNDFHENDYLYINNGNGTFTDRLTESMGHTSRSSMGNDIADINNDGLTDVMVLDMLPDDEKIRKQSGGEDDLELFNIKLEYGYYYQFVRNTLQLNLGNGLYSEIGRLSGVYSTDWSWSPLLCDVDNDGWKDLFITSGIFRRANDLDYVMFMSGGNRFLPQQDNSNLTDSMLYSKMPLYKNVNYLFRNNGDLTFTNMVVDWGFEHRAYSNGSAYADLDNDGDLDLITNNINEVASVYRNNAEKKDNHYLSVKLQGAGQNTMGTGARVTVYAGGMAQVAEQYQTRGFISASSNVLHFGTGKADKADSLTVQWPGNQRQTLINIALDTVIILRQQDALPVRTSQPAPVPQQFFTTQQVKGLNYRHTEDKFVEFNVEKLIPHSLAHEGPALAKADVNGDGLEDVFIGGAAGQESVLLFQQRDGSFRKADVPGLLKNRFSEDVDAAFFDADNDGDPDLYVVRGGNELGPGNPISVDLFLINEKGHLVPRKLPVFSHNGSVVRPGDFDNDGDLDLFVGSRSVPWSYGAKPRSFLLENEGGGKFSDVTGSRLMALANAGMVTDACWLDFDGDKDPDLIMTGEWMQVMVCRNDFGKFFNATSGTGLSQTEGLWNCLVPADIDNDGDTDLIGGNLGRNTMLTAGVKEPMLLYLNDLDNNGSTDPLLCTYRNGVCYPVATFDELAAQLPDLKRRFSGYGEFAGKTAPELFGDAINNAPVKRAMLLESCLFRNEGNGTFTIIPLPMEAQFSPLRSVVVQDVNGDGKKDLILAGNEYAVRPSLGRYDASYGWCMLADTAGSFRALMPPQSGLVIRGDARRLLPLTIAGKEYLLAGVNNGELQVFRVHDQSRIGPQTGRP